MASLKTNGMESPPGFPTGPYEAVYQIVVAKHSGHATYEHFAPEHQSCGNGILTLNLRDGRAERH